MIPAAIHDLYALLCASRIGTVRDVPQVDNFNLFRTGCVTIPFDDWVAIRQLCNNSAVFCNQGTFRHAAGGGGGALP